ncbi:sensor histidine kinase [Dyella japonica]|uniref:histidine kinase n=1 Tax=Dyella japonica TaxID=231455 RepID=A0ABV2K2I2_9GAMM
MLFPATARSLEMRSIVEQVFLELAPEANAKHIGFHFRIDPSLRGLISHDDSHCIGEILRRLLSNAIRFTVRGRVALHVTRVSSDIFPKSVVRFIVIDSGTGMSPQARSTISDRLAAQGTVIDKESGLDRCRELCSTLECELSAYSRLGVGSAFVFQPSLRFEKNGNRRIGPLIGRKIMLLSSVPDWLYDIENVLLGWGCRVLAASSPLELLARRDDSAGGVLLVYDESYGAWNESDESLLMASHTIRVMRRPPSKVKVHDGLWEIGCYESETLLKILTGLQI